MCAMAGRGGDALPDLRLPRDVALRAHLRRHLRVRADLARTLRHPEVELSHAGEQRLLVAVMARQRIVFAPEEALVGGAHHVASRAESIVVLHVLPAGGPE